MQGVDCVSRVDFLEVMVSAVGVDKARCVQAVAAHHAADGIGNQFLHGVLAESGPQFFVGELPRRNGRQGSP